MILREATQADAPAIAAILAGWTRETAWMPTVHSDAETRGFGKLILARCEVTVAEEAGRVLGFLARRGARIEALYLAPEARGRGIGSALMARAMRGHERMSLWCFQANRRALSFYARLGFTEAGRTDGAGNDEKLPDVLLVRGMEASR